MDNDVIIFWLVCFSCFSGVVVGLRSVRYAGRGWIVLYVTILLVCLGGRLLERHSLIYISAAMWLLLVLLPGLIGRLYHRRFLQQQYSAARRLAQIISWLHPADGWREIPGVVHGLELAQRGELTAALEFLSRFQGARSLVSMATVTSLYRITDKWEDLLVWHSQHRQDVDRLPPLLPILLRARGETGDVPGLVEMYGQRREQIGKIIPAASRDMCRLMLFAFTGKRQLVQNLFAGSLAMVPTPTQEFWLATADLAVGASESAKSQLEKLLPAADPPLRLAIERRLSQISFGPKPLDALVERVIEEATREHGHDESFGARRSLFSHQARATQILIILNILMFLAEICFGGSTNQATLYRLGGLYSPAVYVGEWWRLIAALFLHFGLLHLTMNMFALWLLGPFVEFAVGSRRFLVVYFLGGIGSMWTVMTLAFAVQREQLTVGASGCIMGLVGATGALMLRGWLREKALSAKRRLIAMFIIVTMQGVFDSVVPQVSMVAHLSGALIGFAAAMVFRDRFRFPPPQPGPGQRIGS